MATPKEQRAAIIENRALLQSALHGAHAKWETKPTGAAEGEDSWAPKEVVSHMIGAEWFFTNGIAQACGAPAMDRPQVDSATPAEAAGSAARVGAQCDNILRHVSDGDMEKTFELRNQPPRSVAEMLEIMVSHAKDHINQLNAACA